MTTPPPFPKTLPSHTKSNTMKDNPPNPLSANLTKSKRKSFEINKKKNTSIRKLWPRVIMTGFLNKQSLSKSKRMTLTLQKKLSREDNSSIKNKIQIN